MRRIAILFFLSIFLFIIAGNYMLFCWEKSNIQHEIKEMMEQGLNDKDLMLIVIHVNDLSKIIWTKPQNEFVRNGEMFDVVRKKCIDNKVYFYCINDRKESKLISGFKKKGMNDLANRVLRKFIDLKYSNQLSELQLILQPVISEEFHYFTHYYSVTGKIPDPPPNGTSVIA